MLNGIIEKNTGRAKSREAGKSFLIIQTAFIGDVVLATVLIEKLHRHFPDSRIDFLLRKGNEGLLKGHPFLNEVLIWEKGAGKYKNLLSLSREIRRKKYSAVINLQRFAATGALTAFSGASRSIGFNKNPLSFLFTKKVKHVFGTGEDAKHEVERNLDLVKSFTDFEPEMPRLYPSDADFDAVAPFKGSAYICIAPTSVWFTKQFPLDKWIEFIQLLPPKLPVYLLGGSGDAALCEDLRQLTRRESVRNLCGQLSFLQSAALLKDAVMNYVNDSAPMHLCSAMNAPVTAVYCSTVPAFGYGPLSANSHIVQLAEPLYCRPCGLHGYRECPEGHFKCARLIDPMQLLNTMP
ncbi:heptosyltransferase-2 [Anseongella ginsenosidimutans]|uniref:Heptosyltransferase-2 n=1 Tax=Anseongella ginsenosidimutans TaxID=496056 RepID=A0A4R3KQ81_9SPHI|nr:glycosyltransferase family 9 protein [Anseongella ginsenosidimutans]TCS86906.1 heptosyltransferase-2 [Anseongella ginsenosidimutans]